MRLSGYHRRGMVAIVLMIATAPALAQTMRPDAGGVAQAEQAQRLPESIDASPRADWSVGSWGNPRGREGRDASRLPPLGARLFEGGFRETRSDGQNADYRVVPGDQVNLRVWGAAEMNQVLTVDGQGNIFIPGVGPIPAQGVSAAQLNTRIREAVQSIYPDNVEVYTNLQGIQPVAVDVTGYVETPGRYAGVPTDSLLYFLAQAGGVDPVGGSFRRIDVIRDGETVAEADLYDFLIDGAMPSIQFQDGDTVVVRAQGASVGVSGAVDRAYALEFVTPTITGQQVLDYAPVSSDASHVLIRGLRDGEPYSDYQPIAGFAGQTVRNGDEILFSSDQRDEQIVVELEGSYLGPSRYVLPRDATLQAFLDNIPVPRQLTATEEVSIRRERVAERQRMALEDSLRRLESTYLGASSSSPEEAEIRVKEAELISQFVEQARQVEPNGRLVVSSDGETADVRLRDGDVITLPERADSVLISGEVIMPQSVVHQPGRSLDDYIESAGGYTARADDDRVIVVHANGEIAEGGRARVRPGDEILVLPEVPTKNLQLATNITQILYQVAIAAKVALDL